jgi:hypothetical protein
VDPLIARETSADLSMSSWVISTQSLEPIGCPISSRSSSIPSTVTFAIAIARQGSPRLS